MNRVILFLSLLLLSGANLIGATPSGSFVVISNGTASDVTPYTTAFTKADMESYRYQDKRCVIEFDNGLKIEMYSAQELQTMGIPITVSDYKIQDSPTWIQPIFHLNTDGTLSAIFSKANLKQRSHTR